MTTTPTTATVLMCAPTFYEPEYYHLDTALAVLDAPSVARLQDRFPDAIIAPEEDAAVPGLNVVMPMQAAAFADQLRALGFQPTTVDLSELLKAGGGATCCTMALRFSRPTLTP